MPSVTISLIAVIVLTLVTVFGDIMLRLAGSGSKFIEWKWFIIGFLVYCLTAAGWFLIMKHLKFATIGVFYGISTLLLLVLIGVFYFKEALNIYEIIGIVLAVISMVLLGKFA